MEVVEFFGMPRAGKTAQTRMLKEHFKQQDVDYSVFRRRITRQMGNLEELNMVLFESLSKYYDRKFNARNSPEYLIYDRGFYDRIGLSTADHNRGALDGQFKERLVAKLEERLEVVDFPFLCLVDPITSLERKKTQRKRRVKFPNYSEENIVFPKELEFLQQLFEVYMGFKERYPEIYIMDAKNESNETIHKRVIKILQGQ